MKTKIMCDLETLGNRPGSIIVALGHLFDLLRALRLRAAVTADTDFTVMGETIDKVLMRFSLFCRRCGGGMKRSTVIVPGLYGAEDFGGDFGEPGTTISEGAATKPPQNCMKCGHCGHSFIQA